jgi:NADH dehydrogenase/NADH:ubiquinone oxidoreductase subunit G
MDFNIVTKIIQEDEEGNPVEGTHTVAYSGTLENGVFIVTTEYTEQEGETVTVNILTQPFNPVGERTSWTNLEEAIGWFQELSGHIGE